jgi:hypothetical protein
VNRHSYLLTALLVGLIVTGCATSTKHALSVRKAPSTPTRPESVVVRTETWVFHGPLQFMAVVRPLQYAPGNYALVSGNKLYEVLVLAHDLYAKQNLAFSAEFELLARHHVLAATDELRDYNADTLIGNAITLKPNSNGHFSVLMQIPKGANPRVLRVVSTRPAFVQSFLIKMKQQRSQIVRA